MSQQSDNHPKENSLQYEFRQKWERIKKIKETRQSANQGWKKD